MRKRRIWVWTGGVALAIALGASLVVLDAHRRASAAFDRHDLDLRSRIAALRSRPPGICAPLFGDVIPGNGWSSFRHALDGFASIPSSETDELPEFNGMLYPGKVEVKDEGKLDALFSRHTAPLEELRSALRHTFIDPEYSYEEGLSLDLRLGDSMRASQFISAAMTHGHRAGRDRETLDPLILGLALGQEVGRRGSALAASIELLCEELITESWRIILESHQFSADELERAARSLDALRRTRPEVLDSMTVEDILARRTLVSVGMTGMDMPVFRMNGFSMGRSWRFLFSRRLAYAGALTTFAQYYKGLEGLREIPLPHREKEAQKIQAGAFRDSNPIVLMALPAVTQTIRLDSAAQMRWMLMRVSTAIAWYEAEKGAMPDSLKDLVPRYLPTNPVCPLSGKPLGYTPGKVWSFGRDGVDHGGVPNAAGDEGPGGDVVWKVRQK